MPTTTISSQIASHNTFAVIRYRPRRNAGHTPYTRNIQGENSMAGRIEQRLKALNIVIPEAQQPKVAKIKGWSIIGSTLYISGMIPQWQGDVRFIG
ncbi:MAG: hypothetical protein ACI9BW_002917, partial [Gammaproteobacteria bacterium]